MFDIGWQELFIIVALAVIVIGPKELPRVLRAITGIARKARVMMSDFQDAINEAAHDADLEDIKKQLLDTKGDIDPRSVLENTIAPDLDVAEDLRAIRSDIAAAADAADSGGQVSSDEPKRVTDRPVNDHG